MIVFIRGYNSCFPIVDVTSDTVSDHNAIIFRHYEPSKCLEPLAWWYSIKSQKTWIISDI